MSSPPSRGRAPLALGVALAALTALAAVPPAAASTSPGASARALATAARATAASAAGRTVTLITGDKVTVGTAPDGTETRSVLGPDGRPADAVTHAEKGETYVYPRSALRYVAAGMLDRDLFNVTRLIADGYDDAHRSRLPLIVTYTDAAARARTAAPPQGAREVRALSSIQGAAVDADRSAGFWTALTKGATLPDAAARGTQAGGSLAGGIAKVWLDGKVKADLADSTAQIGAPKVWESGDTGAGVDVAVLDTGVDTAHPDLAGQVAATRSFVPEASVEDGAGHGTHVASTIAGTGAASGGKEKGVAPGARLHVGKVLADDGGGLDSWVLAGMEWAAREEHAKIISMSLGAGPSDGTDPMSLAVDRLSAETGALFVIAAGNSGPANFTVSTPAVADAALAVAAVDSADATAEFSSRGPRPGDWAPKPDISAPGVDILAARSQYSLEGEGYYTTMSGTSMATPHVAGAAALLAAQHPDWTGAQLKDALVSTAKPVEAAVTDTGAGRLDIAATSAAKVFGTASAFAGFHGYPTEPGATSEKEITYTNAGDAPVTLDLATRLTGAPTEAFTLSAPRVTVPAHGTATVKLTAVLDRVPADTPVTGTVEATDGGAVHVRTTIGVSKEGERRNLTLTAKDRSGEPLSGTVILTAKGFFLPLYLDATGTLDLRIPSGTYTAWLDADLTGAHGPHSLGLGMLAVTDLVLDRDRTMTFDARKARPITAVGPKASTLSGMRFDIYRGVSDGDYTASSRWPDLGYDSVWTLPTGPKVRVGEFEAGGHWRLEQPALTVSAGDHAYDDLMVHRGAAPLPKGRHTLEAVFAGDGDAAAYRSRPVAGKAVVVRDGAVSREDQVAAAAAAGAKLLLVVAQGYGRVQPWDDGVYLPPNPAPLTVASLGQDEGEKLIARIQGGRRTPLEVTSNPVTEYVYDLVHHFTGAVPAEPVYRPKESELARLAVSFRNYRQGKAIENRSDFWRFGYTTASNIGGFTAPAIGERTDYVTGGVAWHEQTSLYREVQQYNPKVTYRAGTTTDVHWFGPIHRPRTEAETTPLRLDDTIHVVMPGWGDSGAGHIGRSLYNQMVSNSLKLYQGGALLGEASYDQLAVPGLRPERLPYRLVSENTRGEWANPYSTSSRTEWGFTSAATGGPEEIARLPLIQLDYDVDTDVSGRARRHASLAVTPLHLEDVRGAGAIRAATLEVSYDDGATWRTTRLRKDGTTWRTDLAAPASASYATLRTTAADSEGNTVSQTITRAFGLK
ncbi:peptidase [Sphaerisporangium melleum]|uniref:Peptidase n=1 Tax=Sphaerisporangium melleum TaxID=321316 RepID=A0A917RF55_9ACTN|nr:S8 family serine peptidase [Sphaerisporangium melleum]GGL04645.1 peptidase [Sphaerisporangium melleum]GII74097.1 peptidase [Sphaerisporangium melleum]